MKKEIEIPKGATIEIRKDKIVIEYDDVFKPNNGDFCAIDEDFFNFRTLFIYDGETTKNGALSYHAAKFPAEFSITPTGGLIGNPRPATDEEREELLSELHKIGKDWDAEKMQIVEQKWVPKEGETVYFPNITTEEKAYQMVYLGVVYHKLILERGLIFRTRAEAVACAERILEAAKQK